MSPIFFLLQDAFMPGREIYFWKLNKILNEYYINLKKIDIFLFHQQSSFSVFSI